MTPEDPRHGTTAGYHTHRRDGDEVCQPCDDARYRFAKALNIDHARGIKRRIDATRAREHVTRLRNAGLSTRDIATQAGLSNTTVEKILCYESVIIRPTEAAILAVPVPKQPGRLGYVPRIGITRRLRALAAIGWPNHELADRLSVHRSRLANLINDQPAKRGEWAQAATWHAVDALFRDLGMTPGPSDAARKKAKERGWLPPLAFDNMDPDSKCPPLPAITTRATSCDLGSDSGYYRHLRTLKEPACDACLEAHRMYERDRKRRHRAAKREAA